MFIPLLSIMGAAFSVTPYLSFPPVGFTLHWFGKLLTDRSWMSAAQLSILIATMTAVVAVVVGLLTSLVLVRHNFRGKDILANLVLAPLTFPRIVLGYSLLVFFLSVQLLDTLPAILIGHVILTLPYGIRNISIGLYNFNQNLERASMSLGATKLQTFYKVTVPLLKGPIVAAGIFSFLISFSEAGLTVFISGSRTTTLPVKLFGYIEWGTEPSIIAAMSVLLLATSFCSLYVINKLVGIETFQRMR